MADRLYAKIDELATQPRPPGCLKLSGYADFYRIRVGDYRVVYQVRDKHLLVVVIRVAPARRANVRPLTVLARPSQ